MATITATRAAAGFPVFQPKGSGVLGVAWGSYELTANPSPGDIIEFCKVPAGATILGGWLYGDDVDTNASETWDMDVGYAANGVESADTDAFGNFGVQNGDAFTAGNLTQEAGLCFPLQAVTGSRLRAEGPITLSAETKIIGTVVAAAATLGTTPRLTVVIFYAVN
jgi:hypothetical protein